MHSNGRLNQRAATLIMELAPVAMGAGCGADPNGASAEGTAWCWGNNEFGQLGDGALNASLNPVRVRL